MTFQYLGKTKDQRSDANVIYCKCSVDDYLNIIGSDFQNFTIQRKREKHKAYKRLKDDIREGALLPSITLAVKHDRVKEVLDTIDDEPKLIRLLSSTGIVDILDGLQRTYILNELKEEGCIFKEGQELLLEFWLQPDMSKLIYRMIVLNAGQKAMSLRHQVELLFMSLRKTIEEQIDGVEIFVERDSSRRTNSNKYPLGSIVSAYQAYIIKSPELDKANIVAEGLSLDNVMDSSETETKEKFEKFIKYFSLFKELDELAWNYYENHPSQDKIIELKNKDSLTEDERSELKKLEILAKGKVWFASDNVLLSFFAAVSAYCDSEKKERRLGEALSTLKRKFENNEEDPFALNDYETLRSGIDSRKTNIGFATRKLIIHGFKEFFMDEGDTQLGECWHIASDY